MNPASRTRAGAIEQSPAKSIASPSSPSCAAFQCAARSVDAGLLTPHGFNLCVGDGTDVIGGGHERLPAFLRVLTRLIVLI